MKCNCIICDRVLQNALGNLGNDVTDPPYFATVWHSTGNFGSTIYDPIGLPERLEICICDSCLYAKRDKVKVIQVTTKTTYKTKKFKVNKPNVESVLDQILQ